MISRNAIIEELYGFINEVCNKFKNRIKYNIEDFQQHIFLILCEMDENKLIGMYERNELKFWIYYVVKAQATNDKSEFNKLMSNRINIDYNKNIFLEDYDEED